MEIVSVTIKDDDGVIRRAIEAVHTILRVHRDRRRGHRPPVRQLGPVFAHFVGVLAVSNDGRRRAHGALSLACPSLSLACPPGLTGASTRGSPKWSRNVVPSYSRRNNPRT